MKDEEFIHDIFKNHDVNYQSKIIIACSFSHVLVIWVS